MIKEKDIQIQKTKLILEEALEKLSNKYDFDFEIINMMNIKKEYHSNNEKYLSVLSCSEIDYLEKQKNEKRKIQWIAGRYAVKSALFKYKIRENSLLMNLSSINVLKDNNSAPYIAQYPDINCTISHSYPFCIAVVSRKNIGIDIEKIFLPETSLVNYYFNKKEKEVLKDFENAEEYSRKAIVSWTRKEAVSKVLRLGMKMDFKNLDTTEDKVYNDYIENGVINLDSFCCDTFCMSVAVADTDE
ncbi:MAG: 4'-phosphopantetheinyl transferase family protein [Halanaerobiaceae bacterium]